MMSLVLVAPALGLQADLDPSERLPERIKDRAKMGIVTGKQMTHPEPKNVVLLSDTMYPSVLSTLSTGNKPLVPNTGHILVHPKRKKQEDGVPHFEYNGFNLDEVIGLLKLLKLVPTKNTKNTPKPSKQVLFGNGCKHLWNNIATFFDNPLVEAARHGRMDELRQFLADGGGINSRDADGQNAVMAAIEAKETDTVNFLLQYPGLRLFAVDKNGSSKGSIEKYAEKVKDPAIHSAVLSRIHEEDARYSEALAWARSDSGNDQIQYVNAEARLYPHKTALCELLDLEQYDAAQRLLNHPAFNVNELSSERKPILIDIIRKKKVRAVELLLAHPNIDVNIKYVDYSYVSFPLFCATHQTGRSVEIVRLLMNRDDIKANARTTDDKSGSFGETVLTQAVQSLDWEM
eukprot:gene394-834_t